MLDNITKILEALTQEQMMVLFVLTIFGDFLGGVYKAWRNHKPIKSSITREKTAEKIDSYKNYLIIAGFGLLVQYFGVADGELIVKGVLIIPVSIELMSIAQNVIKPVEASKNSLKGL